LFLKKRRKAAQVRSHQSLQKWNDWLSVNAVVAKNPIVYLVRLVQIAHVSEKEDAQHRAQVVVLAATTEGEDKHSSEQFFAD
jgi:hypothetical protein